MDELANLLRIASDEEKQALANILDASQPTVETIIYAFWEKSQSPFTYILDNKPSYKKIVQEAASKLNIEYRKYESVREIEIKIAQKYLETIWEKMTPEQRQEMEQQLKETASEFDKSGALLQSGSIFTALTAAQLSGFGIYLLASTTLGAITGAIGITLPFVVYTTMSSAIAVIIGPVGWIGAGLFAIWQLTGPNYQKIIPAILYVCALRAKQNGGFA
ncbi:MAG TPA: hypothetical protein VK184_20325 [Nostocaceae cyanobacterium]|nr:hypothetical protein [Nostocaceae cyanobacterium]